MAKAKQQKPAQQTFPFVISGPPLQARGVSGLKRTDRMVYDEWLPILRGTKAIKVYREMRDNDAVCGSIYYGADTQIRQTPRTIEPAEDSNLGEEIANHVETCLDDMDQTESEWLSDVNTCMWAAFSLHATSYKIRRGPNAPAEFLRSKHDDGRVGWRDIPIRAQDTVWQWKWRDDGKLLGAFQQAPPKYKTTYLDMEQDELLLFRMISNKMSPEGRSIYRNAVRSWRFLKRIQEFEAIGVERDLAGVLVLTLPPEFFAEDASTDQKATVEAYRIVGERLRNGENACLVRPATEDRDGKTGYDASLLQSGGRRPIDVNEIIKRLESRILVSVLGEAVLLGMQGDAGSSRALHSSKTKLSSVALRAFMTSIEDTINRFAIPRLVRANGWPVELSPKYKFGDIESDDSGELATALATLVNAGIVKSGDALEKYIRIRMGVPLEEEISIGRAQDALGAMGETEARDGQNAADFEAEMAAEKAVPTEVDHTLAQTVTAEEAAEILGVSRSVINRAISRGQLPGAKVGATYRIFRSDLFQHMKGQGRAV